MAKLTYIVPLISLLGIFFGIILKKIANEEIKFGKFGARYFVWMKRIILLFIILIIMYYTENIPLVIITAILGLILSVFTTEYFFLGTALAFGFLLSGEIFMLLASLVFLYGLPYGSMVRRFQKEHIIVALLFFLPFLFIFIDIDTSLMIGLGSGGIFSYLIRK